MYLEFRKRMNSSNSNQNRNTVTVYPGYNNMCYNPTLTQQPGLYYRRHPTVQRPYDWYWHEKPSPNAIGAICAIFHGLDSALLQIIMVRLQA